MRHLAFALVALFVSSPLFACINTYGVNLRGEQVRSGFGGEDLVRYLTEPSPTNWRQVKARIGVKFSGASLDERNDYAAALMHLGEVQDALKILTKIEQEKPGLYATATNLGTAYELAGDNARALQWIAEGIRRNRHSHDESEWLHVRILQAKLNLEKDPQWLRTNAILAMGFGSARVPNPPSRFPVGNDGKPLDAERTADAIQYQMKERLQFVKPPEPIVGDILFDYANLLMRTDILETADAVYKLAIEYGAPRAALAKQRREFIRTRLKR
ncbi:MAG TPA: tetratricopeptide repeat protein [Thermoanaerobaculia bacterium]|nr:tetratricopeptide repeat protein [Thermoanaerobaculia bacterium]